MINISRLTRQSLSLLEKLDWFPPLLTRISIGWVFAQSGWGKIHNIPKVAEFFTELQIPAPLFHAHLVAYTELIGGGLLMIGLLTRLASIPLMITMIVAIATAKAADITEASDLFGMSEFLFILGFLWLLFKGAGAVSCDWVLRRKLKVFG